MNKYVVFEGTEGEIESTEIEALTGRDAVGIAIANFLRTQFEFGDLTERFSATVKDGNFANYAYGYLEFGDESISFEAHRE